MPSNAFALPSLSAMIQTASPPIVAKCGYVTAIVAPIAIAASIAFPPAFSTFRPASLARRCGLVTIPLVERAGPLAPGDSSLRIGTSHVIMRS
jgi:hypothetical protein